MGRIAGDTAIVVILLGASLQLTGAGGLAPFDTLRGTGSTLTSYVYDNSPAGEGNAPEKAYAAAFVLLLIVMALNFAVDLVSRRGASGPSWNQLSPAADPPDRGRRPADDRAPATAVRHRRQGGDGVARLARPT